MSIANRLTIFAFLYVALFIGAMATIATGGIDVALLASAPVILTAEILVLGMIYMTTFHGEAHDEPDMVAPPKLGAYSQFKKNLHEQNKV